MSLRRQLFLWISLLFLITFLLSFVWENYLTHKDLREAEVGLRSAIMEQNELKRERLERFTAYLLLEGLDGAHSIVEDAEKVLKSAVIVLQQQGFLVQNGHVISYLSSKGESLPVTAIAQSTVCDMLTHKSGTIPWQNGSYFYLQLSPLPQADLHFFLLNPQNDEFVLINQLDAGTKQVLNEISLNMRFVAIIAVVFVLFLAGRLAKKITGPITHLAEAAQAIGQGSSFEEVSLPQGLSDHKDEVGTLCHAFEEMLTGLKEKEKVQGILNKVVSREIAQEILKGTIHLGGEEKIVTVLFADIRGFTQLTAQMPPYDVITLLNTCMTKISHAIDKEKGVIDKYVGDEIMAIFGAPIDHPESALHAILSAIEIRSILQEWNMHRMREAKPPIEMGIGIHTGPVLAGNMGAENRLNYTVLGSNVNLAARVCSAAQGMEILITKDTLESPSVRAHIEVVELEPMAFKGFDNKVPVFRVIDKHETS